LIPNDVRSLDELKEFLLGNRQSAIPNPQS
jgi:hypothetical protein